MLKGSGVQHNADEVETREMEDWSEGERSKGRQTNDEGGQTELYDTQESHTAASSEDPMSLA